VRPSPNRGEMGRREHGGSSHLGVGMASVARPNSQCGGRAPMVGAVGKAMGRGVLPVGCFKARTEGGGNQGVAASGGSLLSRGGARQGGVGVGEIG
jgi:hypothetical protein